MEIYSFISYKDLEFILRIGLAIVMGSLIGFERKIRNKEAGIRTHTIVCLAASLIMIVSKYGFSDVVNFDAARVAAQVVSGIGFLGAGLIFIKNDSVNGLTTAAGIWATAGIGLAMGAGLYFVSIFGTALVVIIQILMHKDTFLSKEHLVITFEIKMGKNFNEIKEIRSCLEKLGLEIKNLEIVKNEKIINAKFYTFVPIDFEREHFEDLIFDDERVKKIEIY